MECGLEDIYLLDQDYAKLQYDTHPQFHPLVQQSSVVEFTEEAGLCYCKGGVAHLAPPAGHVAEVVVPLLPQDGAPAGQRGGLLAGPGMVTRFEVSCNFQLRTLIKSCPFPCS